MAGRNLQMSGYSLLESPNKGRELAGQRSREESSHAKMQYAHEIDSRHTTESFINWKS